MSTRIIPCSEPINVKPIYTSSKNANLLESFVSYCKAHPEERFWQALRNWSSYSFILTATGMKFGGGQTEFVGIEDTFYKEGK